jgi:hypothetical protein
MTSISGTYPVMTTMTQSPQKRFRNKSTHELQNIVAQLDNYAMGCASTMGVVPEELRAEYQAAAVELERRNLMGRAQVASNLLSDLVRECFYVLGGTPVAAALEVLALGWDYDAQEDIWHLNARNPFFSEITVYPASWDAAREGAERLIVRAEFRLLMPVALDEVAAVFDELVPAEDNAGSYLVSRTVAGCSGQLEFKTYRDLRTKQLRVASVVVTSL